jgi:hypothetical protein
MVSAGPIQRQLLHLLAEDPGAEEPERADELAVIGARHPADLELPEDVCPEGGRQVRVRSRVSKKPAGMTQVDVARARRVAAEAHLLVETVEETLWRDAGG